LKYPVHTSFWDVSQYNKKSNESFIQAKHYKCKLMFKMSNVWLIYSIRYNNVVSAVYLKFCFALLKRISSFSDSAIYSVYYVVSHYFFLSHSDDFLRFTIIRCSGKYHTITGHSAITEMMVTFIFTRSFYYYFAPYSFCFLAYSKSAFGL